MGDGNYSELIVEAAKAIGLTILLARWLLRDVFDLVREFQRHRRALR